MNINTWTSQPRQKRRIAVILQAANTGDYAKMHRLLKQLIMDAHCIGHNSAIDLVKGKARNSKLDKFAQTLNADKLSTMQRNVDKNLQQNNNHQ